MMTATITPEMKRFNAGVLLPMDYVMNQIETYNGLAAIRDAAICFITVGYAIAKDLNLEPCINDDVHHYHAFRALIDIERRRGTSP